MTASPANFRPYRPAAFLKVAGEDAFDFLQGQFTNELRQENGSLAYGLWLNQKGRVLADSHILRRTGKEFILVSTTSPAAIISQRLESYIVADDVVQVNETEKAHGLAVWGDGGKERLKDLLGSVPEGAQFLDQDQLMVFPGRRIKGMNYEIIGPEEQIANLRRCFLRQKFKENSSNNTEVARLMAGIPAVPQDIGPGDLPNEGGLEHSAISYTKGCYLGQEVMARLRNRGQIRRQLRVVGGTGAAPGSGTALYQGGRKVGEIRSAALTGAGFIAMAMLLMPGTNEGAGLAFTVDGAATASIQPHG